MGYRASGSGLRVCGLEFSSRFRVKSLRYNDTGLGLRV
jgi:hypothetical protein